MAQRQFKSTDTDKWLYAFGDGSDGDGSINTSTDNPIDSACSGTAGTNSLSATNVSFAANQFILIHQTRGTDAGVWELNKIQSYTAGTITLSHVLMNTYTNSGASVAQVLVMKKYNNLTINSGQTLTAKAWNGTVGGIYAVFAKGTATVSGSIVANGGNGIDSAWNTAAGGGTGGGFRGGNGYAANADAYAYSGEGSGGASANTSTAANGNGGGTVYVASPANAWGNGGGGGGGNANAGTAGTVGGGRYSIGGTAGEAKGAAQLTTMVFGGGGGGGRIKDGYTGRAGGGGGAGGGIVLIIADTFVCSSATGINMNGGAGSSGLVLYGGDTSGGGGGGAGGSCLIKAKVATLGTNKITVAAGSGGAGSMAGGAGSVGRIHLDYKTSYTGTTTPSIDVTNDLSLDYPAGGGFLWNFV